MPELTLEQGCTDEGKLLPTPLLEELAKGVTPGKWRLGHWVCETHYVYTQSYENYPNSSEFVVSSEGRFEDMRLMAHAQDLLFSLLAERREPCHLEMLRAYDFARSRWAEQRLAGLEQQAKATTQALQKARDTLAGWAAHYEKQGATGQESAYADGAYAMVRQCLAQLDNVPEIDHA